MLGGSGDDRLAQRHEVLLHARCRMSPWKVFDVELGNISAGGCSILACRERFTTGQGLTLRIAYLKALKCHVSWCGDGAIGVEFREALSNRMIAVLNTRYGLDALEPIRGTASPRWQANL